MKRFFLLAVLLTLLAAPAFASGANKSSVDPASVRQDLRDILSAREYHRSTEQDPVSKFFAWIYSVVVKALGKCWDWLIRHLHPHFGKSDRIVTFILAWVVVLAFFALLGLVVKWLIQGRGAKKKVRREDVAEDYELPSAKPLVKQAAKLAEAGDYRGAFRTAYLASISYLDEARALRFERSRTNWEYLRELKQGGHDMPHNELQPLTLDFDHKIYGRAECVKEDYARAVEVYERITSEVEV